MAITVIGHMSNTYWIHLLRRTHSSPPALFTYSRLVSEGRWEEVAVTCMTSHFHGDMQLDMMERRRGEHHADNPSCLTMYMARGGG